MMPAWALAARSRGVPAAAAGCVVAAVLTYFVGGYLFPVRYGIRGVPYAVLLPFLCACLIGLSSRARFDEFEQAGSVPAPAVRLVCLVAVFAVSAVGIGIATAMLPEPASVAAALRSLAGLTGLALLGAALTGSGTSWVLPLSYVVATVTLSVGEPDQLWFWLLLPGDDSASLSVAVGLGVAGAAAVILRGSREPRRER